MDTIAHPLLAELEPLRADLTALRRDIHRHPEMGFEEHRTASLVAAELRGYGLAVAEGIGGTGVVGTLRGRRPGNRALALRADMDALQIEERTGLPYASETPGTMHACGHDGHTVMLLGAARHLAARPDFAGEVHFVFQPAEEGRGGAARMIADGLFERFPCDAVYGMHNAPGLPVGRFRLRPGPMMAAVDFFTVTFRGTGGHGGSTPHLATDVTIAQAHFCLALQNVIGRNVPAVEPAVVSIGSIRGGSPDSPNVMPADLVITGTVRTFSETARDIVQRRLIELAHAHAGAQGCTAEVEYGRYASVLVNHPDHTTIAAGAAAALVGPEAVDADAPPITGGEDFADMLQVKPGAFLFIGNGVAPDGTFHAVHTPHYDFNDDILTLGAGYWVSLVRQELAA
ncbi:amidohydrolase [Enterovirga sp.]|jgi:amidohydrolase|uniref:amidohydrolase n=1 Tax=Enterovirga sp. TaxID=2026350 RepID=UPI00261407CD|nr:amidohydrolase [Enterovirga sp.]MDB5592993.1 amidohydrolase [Enterovirga sp.]